MKRKIVLVLAALTLCLHQTTVNAALITFDDLVSGVTSYGYDGDGDTIADVIFTTTDPFGFNTFGPGPNQVYINEPGIEGTVGPSLRVDFLFGAIGTLQFGFANNLSEGLVDGVTFKVFDDLDTAIGTTTVLSNFNNPTLFPEALVNVAFAGTASYATFDFSYNQASRYIVDNFEGTFGSTEVEPPTETPIPATLPLLGLGLAALGYSRRKGKLCN